MNYIIHLSVFIIVLIVYLHVQKHFRTACGTDVFELDGIIKSRIDDVLDLKQPVVFRTYIDISPEEEEVNIHAILQKHSNIDIYVVDAIKNTRVASSIGSFAKLQQTAKDMHYYSDGNQNAINRLPKEMREWITTHHKLITPSLTSLTHYDMLFGTEGCVSPIHRYVAHRSHFTVTNGTMEAKLIHPDQLVDVSFAYSPDTVPDSMTSISISDPNISSAKTGTLHKGQTLFVPPYWGVIFQFTKNTFIIAVKHSTYMTEMATCVHKARFWYHKMVSYPTVIPDVHVPNTSNIEEKTEIDTPVNTDEIDTDIGTTDNALIPIEDTNLHNPTLKTHTMDSETCDDAPPMVPTPQQHLSSL